jgi:hypothetical protein
MRGMRVSSRAEFSPCWVEMITSQLSERESVANTQLDTLNHGPERFDVRPESSEGAARAAFDSRAGRTLTDADWAVAKDRLLEFFNILRGWDRKAKTVSRDLVMFEVPCLREL